MPRLFVLVYKIDTDLKKMPHVFMKISVENQEHLEDHDHEEVGI